MKVQQAASNGQTSNRVDHVTIAFEHRNLKPTLEIAFDCDQPGLNHQCYLTAQFTAEDLAALQEFMAAAEKFRSVLNRNV